MRKLATLIAAFVLLQCATSAQYFTTSGLLIRPPGQSNGVIITAPTGLTGNVMFTLPSTAGTILVDDGSGISSAWLLGGNNLDSAGSVGRKLGSTSAHDFQLIAGDTANVRLVMHNATNSFATGPGTTFRLVEPVGAGATNYSSFVAQAQTKNIDYTLPATAGTANQVLQIASTPTPTDSSATLEWATPSGGGGGSGTEYIRHFSGIDNNSANGHYSGASPSSLMSTSYFFANTSPTQLARYIRSTPLSTAKTIRAVKYFLQGEDGVGDAVTTGDAEVHFIVQVCKNDGSGTIDVVDIKYCDNAAAAPVLLTQHAWVTAASGLNIALPNDSYVGVKVTTDVATDSNDDYRGSINFEIEID